MKFILRWAINTVALYVAIILLPHYIILQSSWVSIIWLALIFGLVNAILRPPFKALTCLLIILTLGLFTLIINTLLFALTFWLSGMVNLGITLAQPWFLSAFLGSLVVTIVGGILSGLLRDELRDRRHKSHT
ncbi:MAG: phage holin family protein [Anaerolineales bacterium]|jgi:putative membrane protein